MHISTTVSRMMIQLSCRRRTASMSDGQSTSASCSIDPPQSISVPWTEFPRNLLLNALTHTPHPTPPPPPPTREEIQKAMNQKISGRTRGMDGIPAEIFITAGPVALATFHTILASIWEKENMPKHFKDITIVSLFKKRAARLTVEITRAYPSY